MSLLLLLRGSAVPKLATLLEAFTTTPGNWTATNGATVSGGNAVLPCVSSYSQLEANGSYDFSSSYTQIKVAELPLVGNVSTEAQFFVWNEWNYYVLIEKIGSNLLCRVRVNSVDTDNYLTYDATNHKYWRIDESAGNVLFKTSPDGSTWTTHFTVAHTFPGGVLLDTTVRLSCGYFATETSPGDFRVSSVGPVPEAQGPADGTLGGLTGAFAGTGKGNGALAGSLGALTASFAGTGKGNAALAGTLGGLSATLAGTGKGNGALAGTLGGLTGAFVGAGKGNGTLAGNLGGLTSSFVGTGTASGPIAGSLGSLTGAFTSQSPDQGAIAGSLGSVTVSFAATAKVTGALDGTFVGPKQRVLDENFSAHPAGAWVEYESHGNWIVPPSGNQTIQIVDVSGNKVLDVESEHVGGAGSSITYAGLVLSSSEYDNWTRITAEMMTTAQWRTPTPEDWEVAWLLWNFEHVNHFYYLILKPGAGWEFGKEWHDGIIQRQDFLAYSFAESYPINHNYKITVDQEVNGTDVITSVTIEDLTAATAPVLLVDRFVDDGSRESGAAYPAGRIGLYVEDSTGRFDNITVDNAPMLRAAAEANAALSGTLGALTASFAGASTAGTNTGALAGTLGNLTANFAGTGKDDGVLAGTLGSVTASFTGTNRSTAVLAGALGNVTASLSATGRGTGALAGNLGGLTGSFAGANEGEGPLLGNLGGLTGSFSGTGKTTGTLSGNLTGLQASFSGSAAGGYLAAALPTVTGSFSATAKASGTAAGTLGPLTASFTGTNEGEGPILGNLGGLTGAFNGTGKTTGALSGTLGGLTASFTGSAAGGHLVASLQNVTASFDGTAKATGAVAGTLQGLTANLAELSESEGTLSQQLGNLTGSLSGTARGTGALVLSLPGLAAAFVGTSPDVLDQSDLFPFFARRYSYATTGRE